MRLTRRDALLALTTMGITTGVATQQLGTGSSDDEAVDGLVAVAEVIYPSEVSETRTFVKTWIRGRLEDDKYSVEKLRSLLAVLDREARQSTGSSFVDLNPARRDDVLRDAGAADAFPDPDGTIPQQVRYYLINDLLYALYTSPTGGEITGNENPHGYPGGLQAYQRGPNDE